jgi:hypothetical protein
LLLFFFLSIRSWIFFVLFLHIVILCFISVVYSNCHVCNISQVWVNKTSLTPVKVSGRVFVLGVSICLFLRFFHSVIFHFYFSFHSPYGTCFVLSSGIMIFLLFTHIIITVVVLLELLLYFRNVMFCSCFIILLFICFSCFVYPVCDSMYCSPI